MTCTCTSRAWSCGCSRFAHWNCQESSMQDQIESLLPRAVIQCIRLGREGERENHRGRVLSTSLYLFPWLSSFLFWGNKIMESQKSIIQKNTSHTLYHHDIKWDALWIHWVKTPLPILAPYLVPLNGNRIYSPRVLSKWCTSVCELYKIVCTVNI